MVSIDRLIGQGVNVSDGWSSGRGFDSRYFHSFKCGLDLERGPPASWVQLGSYLIEK